MPVTFDGDNLIITLQSGVTEVEVQDVYEDWKEWVKVGLNSKYYAAFRPDGGNPLSAVINQGSYFFLNNIVGWRIKPPEEDITVYLTGNLAVEDTTLPAFIPTTGAFTAAILGLQPVTQGVTETMGAQLLHNSFNGGVWIDVANGDTAANIGDEAGTEKFPVNNTADALAIGTANGFGTMYVLGDLTVDAGLNYSDLIFIGQGQNLSTLTVSAAANVTNCTFSNASLTGTLDGDSHIEDCIIAGVDFVSGVIEQCILEAGTITLGGTQIAHLINCASGVPGTSTPILDLGGSGQDLALRNFNGGVKLTNKTGTDDVSIDLASGQVRIDLTTVTNGTIVVRGDGKVVDDATGDWLGGGTYGSLTLINETSYGLMLQEVWKRLDLDTSLPNKHWQDSSRITNSDDIDLVSTDNGDGTFTVQRQ